MDEIKDNVLESLGMHRELKQTVIDAVESVLVRHQLEAGVPSMDAIRGILEEKFAQQKAAQLQLIQELSEQARQQFHATTTDANFAATASGDWNGGERDDEPRGQIFHYRTKFHYVPKAFKFPKLNIKEALVFWFCGMDAPNNNKNQTLPAAVTSRPTYS